MVSYQYTCVQNILLLTHFVSHLGILQQTTLSGTLSAIRPVGGAADFPHKHVEISCVLRNFRLRPNEDMCAPLRKPPSASVSTGHSVVGLAATSADGDAGAPTLTAGGKKSRSAAREHANRRRLTMFR